MLIQASSGQTQPLHHKSRLLTTSERILRAAKAGGLFLVVAALCILVPAFHFILVPFFICFSIYAAVSKFNQTKSVEIKDDRCPVCQKPLNDAVRFFYGESFRVVCYECRSQLTIREESQP